MIIQKGKLAKLKKDLNQGIELYKFDHNEYIYNLTVEFGNNLENKICLILEIDFENNEFYNCLIDSEIFLVNIKNLAII